MACIYLLNSRGGPQSLILSSPLIVIPYVVGALQGPPSEVVLLRCEIVLFIEHLVHVVAVVVSGLVTLVVGLVLPDIVNHARRISYIAFNNLYSMTILVLYKHQASV